MEFLEKFFKKRFRILYKDTDIAFEKNTTLSLVEPDEVDDTFYTFGFIPAEYTVLYSLILPAAAEERVDEIVKGYIKENEPSDVSLKVDYSFVKEKGKLKVLIGVLKLESYEQFKEDFYSRSHTLSGILPFQMILIAKAIKQGITDGLAVFKSDGFILGFLFKNGFPISFLKVKERANTDVETVVKRFLSSERIEDENFKIYYFGNEFESVVDGEESILVKENTPLADIFAFLIGLKTFPLVNFLPLKERKVIRRWWRYIAITIVVLAALIYSGIFLKNYFALKKEVYSLKENFEVKKKQALEIRKKMGNVDELKSMVAYFNKQERNKRKVLVLLEELTKKVPKSAYLTRVNISERGDFEINGKAKDVFQVVKSLNNSKYFKNVEKKSSRQSGDYTVFIIRGKIVY